MSRRSEVHDVPVLAIVGGDDARCEVVVAESPERSWGEMQAALGRRRVSGSAQGSAVAGPVDFAAAMRRVEAEVYDAI